MSPMVKLARKAHMQVSRQWVIWLYIAVAVTLVLVLAVLEAIRAVQA